MSSILGKLGSYQILTNILPGAFFVWMLRFLFDLAIPTENVVEDILTYYFVGLVLNRISSLVVQPILSHIRLIKYGSYSDFLLAEKVDPKIEILSETNNSFRSLLTCAIMLPVAFGLATLHSSWAWFSMHWKWFAILFLIALFFFAYRKQTKYICERIKKIANKEREQS